MSRPKWLAWLLRLIGRTLQRWAERFLALADRSDPPASVSTSIEADSPHKQWLARTRSAGPPADWLVRVQAHAPHLLEADELPDSVELEESAGPATRLTRPIVHPAPSRPHFRPLRRRRRRSVPAMPDPPAAPIRHQAGEPARPAEVTQVRFRRPPPAPTFPSADPGRQRGDRNLAKPPMAAAPSPVGRVTKLHFRPQRPAYPAAPLTTGVTFLPPTAPRPATPHPPQPAAASSTPAVRPRFPARRLKRPVAFPSSAQPEQREEPAVNWSHFQEKAGKEPGQPIAQPQLNTRPPVTATAEADNAPSYPIPSQPTSPKRQPNWLADDSGNAGIDRAASHWPMGDNGTTVRSGSRVTAEHWPALPDETTPAEPDFWPDRERQARLDSEQQGALWKE